MPDTRQHSCQDKKKWGPHFSRTVISVAVTSTFSLSNIPAHGQAVLPGNPLTNPTADQFLGLVTTDTISVLTNTGYIVGIFYRGLENQGAIGLLNNSGEIGSTGPFSSIIVRMPWPSIIGLNNEGTIGTLYNTGSIFGVDAALQNSGSIGYLNNDAGITGFVGIKNSGTIQQIENDGTITARYQSRFSGDVEMGAYYGIENTGSINSIRNGSLGTITGQEGISNSGSIARIENAGLISAAPVPVQYNYPASVLEGGTGIVNSGAICALVNTGTIMGVNYAIENTASGTLSEIKNVGVIAGNIANFSSNDLVINGGDGTHFGTLTGYNGTIGTVTNTSSSVRFNSGNIVLNDNINVGSGIAMRQVVNSAAALRIDQPISITGNYQQGQAANLMIGVSDGATVSGQATDSGYGRLVVSGSATIAPGSSITLVKVNTYNFAPGQRFVVVQANGAGTEYNEKALHYAISGISTATLSGTAVTSSTDKDLVVTVASLTSTSIGGDTVSTGSSISSPGVESGTDNGGTGHDTGLNGSPAPTIPQSDPWQSYLPQGALKGLIAYSGSNQPALLNLYNAAQALSLAPASIAHQAASKLSPTTQAISSKAATAPALDALNIVSAHSDNLRLAAGESGIASGESQAENSPGVWAQAFGGHASQSQGDDVSGYSANYAGLLFGVDKALNDAWRLGGAFNYSHAAINNTDATAGNATQVNMYGLIAYATYTAPRWYANLSAGAMLQQFNADRIVNFTGFSGNTSASFPGKMFIARGELGYPLTVGTMTITPLASLSYTFNRQNSYTESGGNGAALSVAGAHATSVQTDLGARLERAFVTRYGVLVPNVQLAWRHEYVNERVAINAAYAADPSGETAFSTLGVGPVSNSAVVSAGITLLRANNLSLTLLYQAQAASGYLSQSGSLRVKHSY